jgi:hypothetical protein
MWFSGRGEVSLRPFSFEARLFAKMVGEQKVAGRNHLHPAFVLQCKTELVRSHQMLIGKNSFEAPSFILIVQHHDGNNAQVLLAGMALRHFALQVLQKTICETIQRTFAPGILLVPRAAVGTDEFHRVLLRIAVQGGPAGAAHTYCFGITPVHGGQPP